MPGMKEAPTPTAAELRSAIAALETQVAGYASQRRDISLSFGKTGDTWYTETKNAKESRTISAKAGTTLTYFCAVHPNMVGTIKVVK